MSGKVIALAAQMLDEYSDRLANDVCEDWDFPYDWTPEERAEAERLYHEWNGDTEEFDPSYLLGFQSSTAAAFVAACLRGEIKPP